MLHQLHPDVRVISRQSMASPDDIESLRIEYPSLPDDVAQLMSQATEVELDYCGRYLRIYGPSGCVEMDEAYNISEHIQGSVVLGDNGGGEAILFVPSRGLCRVGYGAIDIDELTYISDSLTDLLINAVATPDAVGGTET